MKKLRVWWIPQIPMSPFYVPVDSISEAIKILDTLAKYDIFQYEHHIKPDYANTGGLQQYVVECDDVFSGWCDWWDDETGCDIMEYTQNNNL